MSESYNAKPAIKKEELALLILLMKEETLTSTKKAGNRLDDIAFSSSSIAEFRKKRPTENRDTRNSPTRSNVSRRKLTLKKREANREFNRTYYSPFMAGEEGRSTGPASKLGSERGENDRSKSWNSSPAPSEPGPPSSAYLAAGGRRGSGSAAREVARSPDGSPRRPLVERNAAGNSPPPVDYALFISRASVRRSAIAERPPR